MPAAALPVEDGVLRDNKLFVRDPHFGSPPRPPTGLLRRFIIVLAVALVAYASAIALVLFYQGDDLADGMGRFMEALARPALFLTGGPLRQATCQDCALLPAGSHVRLGADTVALLWEVRPASSRSEILIRGAFVPGGAEKVPVDSAGIALVPRGSIRHRDTTILDVVRRDSAVARGLRARGRLFTDPPEARAYTIFW